MVEVVVEVVVPPGGDGTVGVVATCVLVLQLHGRYVYRS